MTKLTFDQFRATRRPCDDKTWIDIVDSGLVDDIPSLTQSAVTIYTETAFMIHEEDGKFFVHAWWYAPLAYDSLEEAEAKLYPWYEEFA